MLVSNFELLVKRIAPLSGTAPVDAPFRRVVQGYFLTVTNLSPTFSTNFFLTFTIPTVSGAKNVTDNEFVLGAAPIANVVTLVDTATQENLPLTLTLVDGNANYKKFNTNSFLVRPLQTVIVVLLPNIGANTSIIPSASIEIRGFVEIAQSRRFFSGRPAIDVLITPETRGTFLDNEYPNFGSPRDLDFDQISYSLPTFSGGAKNTVEAVPALPLPDISIFDFSLNAEIGRSADAPAPTDPLVKEAIAELQEALRLYGASEE